MRIRATLKQETITVKSQELRIVTVKSQELRIVTNLKEKITAINIQGLKIVSNLIKTCLQESNFKTAITKSQQKSCVCQHEHFQSHGTSIQ